VQDSTANADGGGSDGTRLGVPQFIEEVRTHHGDAAAGAAAEVTSGIQQQGLKLYLQAPQGTKGMGFMVVIPNIAWEPTPVASHGKTGTIGWELPNIRRGNPFKIAEREGELRDRLAVVPGMDLSYPHYPKTAYEMLAAEDGVGLLLDALDWTVDRIRGSNPV
jgi:hypothetical protein